MSPARRFTAASSRRRGRRPAPAKIDGRIPHDMRRSAVRNLECASIPRKAAMQMVGHRTETIYRRYHIVAEADIHDAVTWLDALAEGNAGATKLLQFRRRARVTEPRSQGFLEKWCRGRESNPHDLVVPGF